MLGPRQAKTSNLRPVNEAIMVLEAASMSESYDASPDTPDPYETNAQTTSLISEIERSRLPRPLPILGSLFGFNQSRIAELAGARLKLFPQLLGRDATQQERQAILYHESKGVAYVSYGMPLFCAWGLYRAYETRESYRWPLYGSSKSSDGWWNGERIRIMGRNILAGDTARMFVHANRAAAYTIWAYAIGGIFIASFAATVYTVGELRDPRLKDFNQARRAKSKLEWGETEPMKRSKDPTGQGNTSMTDLWTRHRKDIGAMDDASPSAGSEDYGGEAERLGGGNTGLLSDAQMRTQETRQQASPRDSPTENRSSTFQMDKVARQPSSFDDSFGDASASTESNTGRIQGGSAWDRIRRQAQNTSAESPSKGQSWSAIQKEQQQGATTGDSFTFSSSDEDRHLAKGEAQDEFDARVERERQGGSFNESRGKRW